jgi:hypothetical protein
MASAAAASFGAVVAEKASEIVSKAADGLVSSVKEGFDHLAGRHRMMDVQHEFTQPPPGLSWVPCSEGQVPRDAVQGGWDSRLGGPFYIGRCGYKGNIELGKVTHDGKTCYIPVYGDEHESHNYEILVKDNKDMVLSWPRYTGGQVPPGAISGGVIVKSQTRLYIGRTIEPHDGDTVPGKIVPSRGKLYFPSGREHSREDYEVLVIADPDYYEMSDVKYDLCQATSVDMPPESTEQLRATNNGDVENSQKLRRTVTAHESHNMGHQVGIKVGVETLFKCGCPCLAEGKVEVAVEGTYQHSWGNTKTSIKTTLVECKVKVPAKSQVTCKVVAKKKQIEVPYTATVKTFVGGSLSRSFQTSGIYKGMHVSSFETIIEPAIPLEESGGYPSEPSSS